MKKDTVYAHVQIRTSETEPSPRTLIRHIFRRPDGVEWVMLDQQKHEVHVDPTLDVYYLVLKKAK